jgi:hypothetical protein
MTAAAAAQLPGRPGPGQVRSRDRGRREAARCRLALVRATGLTSTVAGRARQMQPGALPGVQTKHDAAGQEAETANHTSRRPDGAVSPGVHRSGR